MTMTTRWGISTTADDDEMGHLYNGLCDTKGLGRTMLEDWENNQAVEDNDIGKAIPNQHLRWNRERFSTPQTARDPNRVNEIELESEDLG